MRYLWPGLLNSSMAALHQGVSGRKTVALAVALVGRTFPLYAKGTMLILIPWSSHFMRSKCLLLQHLLFTGMCHELRRRAP